MSKRKLIEVALPLNSLNTAAQKDKNPFLKGHPRSLHLWWSRKPLAVCRAILFASLVDDPSSCPELFPSDEEQGRERKRLLSILETLITADASDDRALESAKQEIEKATDGLPPLIYDPFAGGGSIPLEAKRLGLEAHSSDINPLAVIINKALIEIPEKFHQGPPLAEAINYYDKWMQLESLKRLGHLYSQENEKVIAWLYCRSVRCANSSCGADVPLISKFWLCTKSGKQAWLNPVIDGKKVRFEILSGEADAGLKTRLAAGSRVVLETGKVAKAAFQCLVCSEQVKGKYIDSQAANKDLGFLPLAKVIQHKRGRKYLPYTPEQLNEMKNVCVQALSNYQTSHAVPTEKAHGTFASNAQGRSYGFKSFSDYFLPRQLLSLCVLSDLIAEVKSHVVTSGVWKLADDGISLEDGGAGLTAFADAIATYMAFSVNHLVRYSTLLNPWNTTNQNVAQIFGRQAMQMTWDFAEANILEGALTIATASEWVASAVQNLPLTTSKPSTARQLNSVACKDSPGLAVVVTDPPYYNYISYADLSDFFYVWLKRSLGNIHPRLLSHHLVPKDDELVVAPHRFAGSIEDARRHFIDGLTHSFAGIQSIQNAEYPTAVFYAFNPKEIEQLANKEQRSYDFSGWEAMLESLISSGWILNNYWTLATERSTRMVARGTKCLASSLLLILRKRPLDASTVSAHELCAILRAELPGTIAELNECNLAQVDKLQLGLLEGAKILSRYRHIVDNGGQIMPVSQAIKLVVSQLFVKVT
jgi:putative DNA methylase